MAVVITLAPPDSPMVTLLICIALVELEALMATVPPRSIEARARTTTSPAGAKVIAASRGTGTDSS
ncbi:MAG: hypothetical protein C4321_00150 [Chloroflexota bacterium]